jgi:gluconokinase
MNKTSTPPALIVMGVTGCGKTAVGKALAKRLGANFIEGDALHPQENVAKMASGTPLDDNDRAGWLDTIGRNVADEQAMGKPVVATCSALKRAYRDRLRKFVPDAIFVHLVLSREESWRRVSNRPGHFMPASLVDSQFATLEAPAEDEAAISLDATRPIKDLVEDVVARCANAA